MARHNSRLDPHFVFASSTSGSESKSEEIDFRPYLEAANLASLRTRSTAYVLVVAVVIIFTTYRHTITPDWLDARLTKLQTAFVCMTEKLDLDQPKQCEDAVKYSRDLLYTGKGAELPRGDAFRTELREQISILIRLRTEALTLRLPFVGMAVDSNDLGLLGGIFLTSILYILHAWLYREVDNLKRAKDKTKTLSEGKRKEHLEHLLMTQVLTSRKGITVGVFLLLAGVVAMHWFVLRSDLETYGIAETLQGSWGANLETILDKTFFAFVCVLSVLCGWQQWKLDRSVDALLLEVDGPKSSLWFRTKRQVSKLRSISILRRRHKRPDAVVRHT